MYIIFNNIFGTTLPIPVFFWSNIFYFCHLYFEVLYRKAYVPFLHFIGSTARGVGDKGMGKIK